jgi:hypothetical protein
MLNIARHKSKADMGCAKLGWSATTNLETLVSMVVDADMERARHNQV